METKWPSWRKIKSVGKLARSNLNYTICYCQGGVCFSERKPIWRRSRLGSEKHYPRGASPFSSEPSQLCHLRSRTKDQSLPTPLDRPCIGPPTLEAVCCVFFSPHLKCLSFAAGCLLHLRAVLGFANLSLSSMSPRFMEGDCSLTQKDIFILVRRDWVQ